MLKPDNISRTEISQAETQTRMETSENAIRDSRLFQLRSVHLTDGSGHGGIALRIERLITLYTFDCPAGRYCQRQRSNSLL